MLRGSDGLCIAQDFWCYRVLNCSQQMDSTVGACQQDPVLVATAVSETDCKVHLPDVFAVTANFQKQPYN